LLQAIQKASSAPVQLVQRAQIILQSAKRQKPGEIAPSVGVSVGSIRTRVKRFNSQGLLGVFDEPRSGRPREYTAEQALQVTKIATTPPGKLEVPINTWSLSHLRRYLKEKTEVGKLCRETIRSILNEQGISLQQAQRWQDSPDPELASKTKASIDGYLNPPENTILLCFDQKGPVQFKQHGGHN